MEIGEALLTVYDDPMSHVVWGTAGHIVVRTFTFQALSGTADGEAIFIQ